MRFEFATATQILFGPGTLRELGSIAKSFGGRALMVTGRDPNRGTAAAGILKANGVQVTAFSVSGEPDLAAINAGTALGREEGCDLVIGIGGGSALDAGKAIAAMLANSGELLDYLEVIGAGKPLSAASIPFIAIPTTAGTGTEVTRNAVLASPEHRVKVSLRSPLMLPRVAIVDPELTCGLPPAITASTGLDALTQLIEPYVCVRANPITDSLCREGIVRVARSLRRAVESGGDPVAREDMAIAALFGGLALANAGLGAVHGFAAPIGGSFTAAHGAVCAILLPEVMEVNLRALRQRGPLVDSLARYDEVARLLTGNAQSTAEVGVNWIRRLVRDLKIPRLGTYGIRRENVRELVNKAANASSMKANPIVLTPAELAGVLESAL